MELINLDKVNEAQRIVNGVRDNILSLENSKIKLIPNTICIVLEVALDRACCLLNDVASVMETELV